MNKKTFAAFVGPSVFMMFIFIALPLVSVFFESFKITQPIVEQQEVETCTPGFIGQTCVTEVKTVPVLDENGKTVTQTEWVGLQSYRNVLQLDKVGDAISSGNWGDILQIDFWKALRFTLMFTLLTLPLVLVVGLSLALAVNNAVRAVRGPVIFISLLPFIITPVIGSLAIYWLFVGDGILTSLLERWTQTNISMFAQAWTIELLMYFFRVWNNAPFAFVIFYAGLQTVNMDTLESAVIDGASRWERLRHVIIPHLMPLIIFISIIHLMDVYRVFEEIVGFRSQAHVISLQWLTYDFLVPDDAGNRAISRASASAMLTMIGIVILLIWPLRRTWLDHKGGAH
ncbi:carbohydrate ABC transporter permease [Sulfitobacter aestuariivivens]|uniref:Sugar ABC transporter permease n=1 Tax=Sulfitobacter aestuariivivens TaxID=2766981 RepID=A0A927HGH8_9RHOB|nr:sugar ABC transporter permease [Sulfitobacter aestuariivivens]MBD3664255.1 sugar ABC transporter permease [Sulfitobacter aestuariivivens]